MGSKSSTTEIAGTANTGFRGGVVQISNFRFVNSGKLVESPVDTYGISGNIEYTPFVDGGYLVIKLKSTYKGEVFTYERDCTTFNSFKRGKTEYAVFDPNDNNKDKK